MFRRNKTDVNKRVWCEALEDNNKLFSRKRTGYWNNLVASNRTRPAALWRTVNKILCRDVTIAPSEMITDHTPSSFAVFFKDKIEKVRKLTSNLKKPAVKKCALDGTKFLSQFSICNEDDVKKIVLASPAKSCCLDCIPTNIFKKFIDIFLPFLNSFINLCLSSSSFPKTFKHAIVSPRLKKACLDKNDIANYRPVSNLSFLSKLIERIAAKQLLSHLTLNNLMPECQSGYRNFHSTETALLDVSSELFAATDAQNVSLLALLDMSSAFDCVDHTLLLEKLSCSFGIEGTVAKWFESYLSERTQQIVYSNELSEIQNISFGVPQGSVLGPVLFLLYTADVFDIVEKFNFKSHAFADDIQIIASCPALSFQNLVDKMILCLSEIDVWMATNRLKLNQCKTQLLPIGTWHQTSKINFDSISVGGLDINFCFSATSLGFTFDSCLTMHEHIKALTSKCSFQLRKLRTVRQYLNEDTMKSLVHAFVHSRIDYCNSLFYGLSNKSITRLQSIQNQAAKVVVGGLKFDHVGPIFRDLHWLSVEKRIIFKIATLMYKCMNGLAPAYLRNKCKPRVLSLSHHQLRSNELNFLTVPSTRLKIGSRDFSVVGPAVWNSLPHGLRQPGLLYARFRKELKAYLFDQ